MTTREELKTNITNLQKAVAEAEAELLAFDERLENNVFETMEKAEAEVEEALLGLAIDACEGSYNCGQGTALHGATSGKHRPCFTRRRAVRPVSEGPQMLCRPVVRQTAKRTESLPPGLAGTGAVCWWPLRG